MKEFINYLWKNGLLSQKEFKTTDERILEITSSGRENTANRFTDTKLKINNIIFSGDTTLDIEEGAKDETRINICLKNDNQTECFNLAIPITHKAVEEYHRMKGGQFKPPCERIAATHDSIKTRDFLTRLLIERIEEKAERITNIYESCNKKWNDTLFKLLARSFGFGIQGHAFEEWALLLNLQALGKHRNNIEQVEAIMFGQAGLLEEESIPTYYRNDAIASEYYQTLVREYKFLKSKFNLQEMHNNTWGYGNSTPHIRIARLATLFHNERPNTTGIAECKSLEELRNTLQSQPSNYWQHHTQFGSTLTSGTSDLSNKQLDVLIINTVVPMLYTYGKHRQNTDLCNKAEDFLYEIGAESNSIIRRWTQEGLCINCAADSQALIQLNNSYCKKHRCAECRFAHAYFKEQV